MRHSLMPDNTPDYMADAWASCMSWAIGNPDIIQTFREESGLGWKPALSAIDRAIDEATGAETHFITEFIKWANINVWGDPSSDLF